MREPDFWRLEDGRAAHLMAESMAVDGWIVIWSRAPSDGWIAQVCRSGSVGRSVGRGLSRVSAIVEAQLAAVRLLGREPWLRPSLLAYRLDVQTRTECLLLN